MVHIIPLDLSLQPQQSWSYQGTLTLESGRVIAGNASPTGQVVLQIIGVLSPANGSFTMPSPLVATTMSNTANEIYYTVPAGLSAVIKSIILLNESPTEVEAAINLFIE